MTIKEENKTHVRERLPAVSQMAIHSISLRTKKSVSTKRAQTYQNIPKKRSQTTSHLDITVTINVQRSGPNFVKPSLRTLSS
jgi:hypothetical protein